LNHQNWRSQALLDAQKIRSDSIHYTSIQTLSFSDFEKLKELILKFIDNQRDIIKSSKEEQLACFTCDWFRV
ncbi:MAG: hypothetical protein ABL927_14800, partial [Bdellovibrionales bacterium]